MRWMQSIGTPASNGATILVPLFHAPNGGELVALRARDGAVLWRVRTNGIYEAPVIWHVLRLVAEAKGARRGLRSSQRNDAGRLDLASKFMVMASRWTETPCL